MDSGSLADWSAAVAAFGALAASVAAGSVSLKMLRLEHGREEAAQKSSRQAQASRVFAWGVCLTGRQSEVEKWALCLQNASSGPIFDVVVQSEHLVSGKSNHDLKLSLLPPGTFVVPGDARYHWARPIEFSGSPEPSEIVAKKNMVTGITFTDAGGRSWRIDGKRRLELISGDDQP